VLCEPTAEVICDLEDEEILKAANEIQRRLDSEAEAAAQAEAEAAAQAEAEAAAQAEAEAAAQAEAEAAAQAEAEAAAQAEAEAAAQAQADAAAKAEADAAAQSDADAAAKAEADAAAQSDSDAAAQAEADAAAQAEADATAQAEADAAAQAQSEAAPEAPTDAEIQAKTEAALAEGAAETTAADGTIIDPAAGLVAEETPIDPDAPLIDAPIVSDTEAEALSTLLVAPADPNDETAPPEVAAPLDAPLPVIEADAGSDAVIDPATAEAALNAIPPAANTVATTVETVTAAQTRSSTQEFKAAPKKTADGKKTGLSDLEKVGLFVLGAVVIGQVLNSIKGKSTVVSNTGDRVVVQNPDGSYGLYKDDDAILRQAGSTVRTETYNDGSSRTIVQRADGTQVVTVRDATGRVLRRAQYDRLGRELVLLDEFAPERPVNVADLPRPRVVGSTRSEDAALRAAIAARQIEKLGRGFSLRQIRDIAEVRALAAEVDVERVTFASGSAAITPEQANALADLGAVMQDLLVKNPAEMFLVEGHTDATGAAALNLALSDRRAESVALALSEYFAIPPENMIIQGYGETELRIDTQASEPQNRRVAVRLITPLLRPAS
jgi:outer membrane protein OmpA-like peptidoglycan-associated protein